MGLDVWFHLKKVSGDNNRKMIEAQVVLPTVPNGTVGDLEDELPPFPVRAWTIRAGCGD
jgi:hypothetical protein